MKQLALFLPLDETTLRSSLAQMTNRDVSLTITDNSTSMLSARMDRDILKLRLHRMFLHADNTVLNEIASYIAGKTRTTPLMRKFIDDHSPYITASRRRSITLRTEGTHHDLRTIFDSLNCEYFDNRITASITWGKRSGSSRARRRTLGSYFPNHDLIRINPILDNKNIPSYFVQYVVYHEMLHAHIGIPETGGRRSHHPEEFKIKEKEFKHYEKALGWEKKRW